MSRDWGGIIRTSRTWRLLRWLPVWWLTWFVFSHPSAKLWGEEFIAEGRRVQPSPSPQKVTHAMRWVDGLREDGQPVRCLEWCELLETQPLCHRIRCEPVDTSGGTPDLSDDEFTSHENLEISLVLVPRTLITCVYEKFKSNPTSLPYQLLIWKQKLERGEPVRVDFCKGSVWKVRLE